MSTNNHVRKFTILALALPVVLTVGCPGKDESQQTTQPPRKLELRTAVLEESDIKTTRKDSSAMVKSNEDEAVKGNPEAKGALVQGEAKQDPQTTTEPIIWSWPHDKKRLKEILNDFHEVHEDIDKIVFDMDDFPVEVDFDSSAKDREGTKEKQ